MNFAECLQAAVQAGELDPERARLAQEHWRKLADRYEARSASPADARQKAADDMVAALTKAVTHRRHVTVRQLQMLQRNQARYGKTEDPDLILKDIEHAEREGNALFKQVMGGGFMEFLRDHSVDILGRVRGRAQLGDIVRELHGQSTGNAQAKLIADAINAQRERLRNMLNSLGGDIGKLDDYGVRHTHDAAKIRAAGFDDWFDGIWKRLDWSRIENHATGKEFSLKKGVLPFEDDARAFLRGVYDNISTNGWHDRTPGFSVGARALFNGRGEHRILHFKTADDWLAYNDAFGAQNPFEAIISEFRGMAMDIARMRVFGPNPKAGYENAVQVIQKAAQLAPRNPNAKKAGLFRRALRIGLQPEELADIKAKKGRVMMRMLSGELNAPADVAMANFMGNTRNLLIAAQLGGATLSQVTDLASMSIAARALGMSGTSVIKRTFDLILNGMDPKVAQDLGFIMDSWAQASATQARYMGDIHQPELTGRISNFVLKANGMTYLTDRSRVGVAMAMGSDLAGMAGKSFDQLHPSMRAFMENRGITAADWDLLRDPRVIYTDPTGGKHMNPNWFREHAALPPDQANDLAIRFGAMIEDQIEMSIPSSSLRGRATMLGETRGGTLTGELARSMTMYKSYPLSVMFNQMRRITELDGSPGSRAAYAASAILQLTVMGALAVQLKEIAKGRDPRPMNDVKFWGAAFLQGGGVGIFGDFITSTTSRTGGGLHEVAGGPVVGLATDLGRAVFSNAARVMDGKAPLIGRDAVNLAQKYIPGARIPAVGLAFDRLIIEQIRPWVDPDAQNLWRQAEGRQAKENGNASWWRRGNPLPDRAPNLSNIMGGTQ